MDYLEALLKKMENRLSDDQFLRRIEMLWQHDNLKTPRSVLRLTITNKLASLLKQRKFPQFLKLYNLYLSLDIQNSKFVHENIFGGFLNCISIIRDICQTKGNSEVIKIIIEKNINRTNVIYNVHGSRSALHLAVRYSDYDTVKILLSYVSEEINLKDFDHNTALHIAVELHKPELVELLLEHRFVEPNLLNFDTQTPLHVAIMRGHRDIIDLLLQHFSIDLNTVKDSTGKTCREQLFSKYPEYEIKLGRNSS